MTPEQDNFDRLRRLLVQLQRALVRDAAAIGFTDADDAHRSGHVCFRRAALRKLQVKEYSDFKPVPEGLRHSWRLRILYLTLLKRG